MHFSKSLREKREALDLSRAELAARVNELSDGTTMYQSTIYKIENNKRKVSIGEAVALFLTRSGSTSRSWFGRSRRTR